jgi:hypothetical protein
MYRDTDIMVSALTGAIAGAISSSLSTNVAAQESADNTQSTTGKLEQWKEINEHARHWEKLVFESAKNYFTVIAAALAAAGVALSWTTVHGPTQQAAIICFLAASFLLSGFALISVFSQKRYLSGFYKRRKEIECTDRELRLRAHVKGSGWTLATLIAGFAVAMALSTVLLVVAVVKQPRPLLYGAKFQGADLSMVEGLRQADLEGACGDVSTKTPKGLRIEPCPPPAAAQAGAAPARPSKPGRAGELRR